MIISRVGGNLNFQSIRLFLKICSNESTLSVCRIFRMSNRQQISRDSRYYYCGRDEKSGFYENCSKKNYLNTIIREQIVREANCLEG